MTQLQSRPTTTAAGLSVIDQTSALRMIPHDQLGGPWSAETAAGRKYVLDWIKYLEPLRQVERGHTRLFKLIAQQKRDHRGRPEKEGNVKKRYYAYLHGLAGQCYPMWDELIDRKRFPRRSGDKRRGLDVRFIDSWKKRQEDTKRLNDGGRQAHRDLLSDLTRWEADPANPRLVIPGYKTPPPRDSWCEVSQCYVPTGWSYRNLIRPEHRPRKINRVNVILGPKAAAMFLPGNQATRVGLKYREIVFSDDQEYDNRVITFLNRGESMRPQGFNTLDYLTGEFQTIAFQMRRRDEDSGTRKGIDQEFYVWTILADLMKYGFRDDERGTTLIRELGTAKGYNSRAEDDRSFDEILHHITGGRVIVDCSGRFDQGMFAQMFFRGKGRGKQAAGNFKYKAPIESVFRRVRTQSASLLGHTSQNERLLGPEDSSAMDGYTKRLFKVLEKNVPENRRELLWNLARHMKHTWDEFALLMSLVYPAVNARRDHKIEGWGRCGFIVPGYAMKNPMEPWAPPTIYTRDQVAAMPEKQRDYIEHMADDHQVVLSPTEAASIQRATDRKIAKLGRQIIVNTALPIAWAYPRRRGKDTGGVRVEPNGTLIIRDPMRFGPDPLVYLGACHHEDALGRELITNLRPGEQYLVHVSPLDPDEAWLLNLDGRYVGYLKLMPRPCANDIEARLRTQGMINQYHADVTRDSHRRQEVEIAERKARFDHNERLIAGDIQPTAEQIAAEELRQATIAAIDVYDPEFTTDDAPEVLGPEDDHDEDFAQPATDHENVFARLFGRHSIDE